MGQAIINPALRVDGGEGKATRAEFGAFQKAESPQVTNDGKPTIWPHSTKRGRADVTRARIVHVFGFGWAADAWFGPWAIAAGVIVSAAIAWPGM